MNDEYGYSEGGEMVDRRAGERRAAAPVVAVVAANLTEIVERYLTHGVLGDMPNHRQQLLSLAADVQALASQAQAAVSAPALVNIEHLSRYDLVFNDGEACIEECAGGDYVHFDDVEKLLAAQAAVGVAKGDFLPTREVHEEIVLLSNVMREHPQLKSVIGREALLMRCVRKALAGEQQPQPSCMPPTRGTGSQRQAAYRAAFDDWWHEGAHPYRDAGGTKKPLLNEHSAWHVWLVASVTGATEQSVNVPRVRGEGENKASNASPDLASIASQAQGEVRRTTDISTRLMEYAGNPGYSHNDYADTMRQAAFEIERYYGGMCNWKENAQAKDRVNADAYAHKIDAARNKALDEAAGICDGVNNHDNPMTAGDCADAIRALKTPTES